MDAAPAFVQSIYDAMYSTLPPEETLVGFVRIYTPLMKIIQLLVVASCYSKAKYQPFSRNVYKYASAGAIMKLLDFFYPFGDDDTGIKLKALCEDLSFCFPLMGVIVTTGLDFLWALSSSIDSDILFTGNISEPDFVANMEQIQPLIVLILAMARYAPIPFDVAGVCISHACFTVFLLASYGFIWYCLYNVKGASTTKRFKDAYFKASTVSALVSICIIAYDLSLIPCIYDSSLITQFMHVTHFLETTSIVALVAFFAYLKAPPADLQKNKMNWSNMNAVLRAKEKLLAAGKKSR